MNAPTTVKVPTGLDLLRQPFPPHQISKLPKPTKAQTDAVRADFKKGIRCEICGAWHHPDVVHLDYVGHADKQIETLNRLVSLDIPVGVFRNPETAVAWLKGHWPHAFAAA